MLHTQNAIDVTHKLRIDDNEIETTKSVKLSGVEVIIKLSSMNIYLRFVLKRQCN